MFDFKKGDLLKIIREGCFYIIEININKDKPRFFTFKSDYPLKNKAIPEVLCVYEIHESDLFKFLEYIGAEEDTRIDLYERTASEIADTEEVIVDVEKKVSNIKELKEFYRDYMNNRRID